MTTVKGHHNPVYLITFSSLYSDIIPTEEKHSHYLFVNPTETASPKCVKCCVA